MEELILNEHQLLAYLEQTETTDQCSGHPDFLEWNNETPELIEKLVKIGQMDVEPAADQYNLPYWGKDSRIVLDKYPYYGCDLFQCRECNALFFYYLELGGHGAQKRYRMLRSSLFEQYPD